MEKVNELEKNILEKFFKEHNINIKNKSLDKIFVKEREYTGVGFFTRFDKQENLKVNKSTQRIWDKLGAKINNSQDTGYIVYAENNYINCIEGYTYQESWPSEIKNFEFYKLP